MGHVWIAGPKEETLSRVGQLLLDRGHKVTQAAEPSSTLDPPDLLVVHGAEQVDAFRDLAPSTPLLVFLPENEQPKAIEADVCLRAPIDPEALLLRTLRLLDPLPNNPNSGVVIDPTRHRVLVDGEPIRFTATEFRLLRALAERPGEVFTRRQLLRSISNAENTVTERSIDAHIRSIRKKLGLQRDIVETVRGVGYRFAEVQVTSPSTAREPARHPRARFGLVASAIPSGVFLLEPGNVYDIGRSPTTTLVLPHPSVSRNHARLEWREKSFWLVDLSSNGTTVGDEVIDGEQELEDRDEISIGPFHLRFRVFAEVQRVLDELTLDEQRVTPHPATSAPRNPPLTRFSGRTLVQFCQLLNIRRQDGVVEVEGEEATGKLEFYAGFIVDADNEIGMRGEDAARSLLRQTGGYFRMRERDKPVTVDAVAQTVRMHRVFEALDKTTELLRELELYHNEREDRSTDTW